MVRHGFMDHYKSPVDERSMYKNVPITLRHHPFVKGMMAVGCRVRYRGPREHGGYHTLKQNATRFSIYPPSQIREYWRGPDNHWHGHTFWPWDRPHHRLTKELEDRLAWVRDEMADARKRQDDEWALRQHLAHEEQDILKQLNRYNSVT